MSDPVRYLVLSSTKTLRESSHIVVKARILGIEARVLVDTGATSNFVNFSLVKKFKLRPYEKCTVDIRGIDDRVLVPAGKGGHHWLTFQLNGRSFTTSFTTAPCMGYDLVLGLPYLT